MAWQKVDAANARMAQIKRFTILPRDGKPGGDELTSTSKLEPGPMAEKYAAQIAALHAEG